MMIRRFLNSFGGVQHLAQHVVSGEEVEDEAGRYKPPRDGVKTLAESSPARPAACQTGCLYVLEFVVDAAGCCC